MEENSLTERLTNDYTVQQLEEYIERMLSVGVSDLGPINMERQLIAAMQRLAALQVEHGGLRAQLLNSGMAMQEMIQREIHQNEV